MSNTAEYDQLIKELGLGQEEVKTPAIKIIDPVTNQPREYQTPEELQASINAWHAENRRREQELLQRAQPTVVEKPVEKPTQMVDGLTVEELKHFNALVDGGSPRQAFDYMIQKTDAYKKLQEQLQAESTKISNTAAVVSAANFMNKHKAELVENPNAMEVQNLVSQIVQGMGVGVPNELHMEIALNNVKQLKPELFNNKSQSQTQQAQSVAFYAPPVPERNSGGGESNGMSFTQIVEKLYNEKGPDAAKAFIQRAGGG